MRKIKMNVLIIFVILVVSAVISMSCGLAPAQSPTLIPPTVSATPTQIPPSVSGSPNLAPTASASAAAATGATTSATISTSAIQPNWTPPALSGAGLPADLSGIVDKVLPSVASINVSVSATNIFGRPTTQQGAGSGWVIDSNGLIVTNSHVVQGASNVTVSMNDGRVFTAQQITADAVSDLAIIKINATGLPVVTLGDSSKLKVGMTAIAIGNALGQGLSMTAGWVSRLGVSLNVPATSTEPGANLFDLIEVSTPINPGNSGGPLIDSLGEVVGITNAKLVATGVENVGYAISIKTALPVIQQLIQTGKVSRPYLGVGLQDVTPQLASIYGLAVKEGALVTQVDPGGPAAGAGLKAGDVIVTVNNTNITSAADAIQAILSSKIGQQISIAYYRGSNKSTVQTTLVQSPGP
jgi:serine protease Do